MRKKSVQSIEIERKYLVTGDAWRSWPSTQYRQGYITESGATVRARVAGNQGFLTIKGKRNGIARAEFEYPIPAEHANWIIETLCENRVVEKTRHRVEHGDVVWEVDEFHGPNAGLVIAEVELESENQAIDLPDWIGREVTEESRFGSARLATRPFTSWPDADQVSLQL
ncbi:MAG: CYTH domain-containing protein [Gemmatimonadales bacterium]